MANFTITITNKETLAGGTLVNKWQEYNWNAFKWLENTKTLPFVVGKGISESEATTSTVGNSVQHPISESTGSTSAVGVAYAKAFSDTVTTTGTNSSEHLTDSAGYSYVFPSNTTEGESRSTPTYASGTTTAVSFTCQAANSTTWG